MYRSSDCCNPIFAIGFCRPTDVAETTCTRLEGRGGHCLLAPHGWRRRWQYTMPVP